MCEVAVHCNVSKIGMLCKGVTSLTHHEKSREDMLKEVIFSVQVCLRHSEAYHCFQFKLNHPIVTEVMQKILKLHGTFEVLLFNMFIFKRNNFWWENYLGIHRSHTDWNEKPNKMPICYVSHEDSLELTEYFLRYASETRLVYDARPPTKLWYQNRGPRRRVVDLPMEIGLPFQLPAIGTAIRLGNSKVLLLLLRHGARLVFANQSDDRFDAADYVISCLFKSFQRGETNFLSGRPRFQFLTLCYVMRAVPSINVEAWAKRERLAVNDLDSNINTFTEFFSSKLVPPSRLGRQPPELKHLSKLAIRRILNANWSLPNGIYSLGLPASLEEYLDLRRD